MEAGVRRPGTLGLIGLILTLLGFLVAITPFPLYLLWPGLVVPGLIVCLIATLKNRGRAPAMAGLACFVALVIFFMTMAVIDLATGTDKKMPPPELLLEDTPAPDAPPGE